MVSTLAGHILWVTPSKIKDKITCRWHLKTKSQLVHPTNNITIGFSGNMEEQRFFFQISEDYIPRKHFLWLLQLLDSQSGQQTIFWKLGICDAGTSVRAVWRRNITNRYSGERSPWNLRSWGPSEGSCVEGILTRLCLRVKFTQTCWWFTNFKNKHLLEKQQEWHSCFN